MMTNSAIRAGVHCCLDAIDHLRCGDEFLPGPMTATLAPHLVFHVHRRGSGALHGADGAGNVEGATPPGVDIHQQRQAGDLGNAAHVDQHIFHAADTQVGHAQRIGRYSSAGQVQCAITRSLRHARRVGVDGANHLQWMLLLNGGAEAFSAHDVPFSN
jgi:hypothetical protein